MNPLRIAAITVALLTLQGCAAVGLAVLGTGAGVAASAGIDHTLNGIAYKTFAASPNATRFATLKTLARMEMPVMKDSVDKENTRIWEIVAEASDRTIEIELEELTPRTTRMRVIANNGPFFKDAATATEIIVQTAATLDADVAQTDSAGSAS
ncbi:MAG: DUF3568 family protein [Alphaproteobacteria bacterium]